MGLWAGNSVGPSLFRFDRLAAAGFEYNRQGSARVPILWKKQSEMQVRHIAVSGIPGESDRLVQRNFVSKMDQDAVLLKMEVFGVRSIVVLEDHIVAIIDPLPVRTALAAVGTQADHR